MSSEKVYLMQHELGPTKIGVSKNPRKRLEDIDIGPFEVRIIGVLECEHPRKLERALHSFHSGDKIRGEWFDLDIEQIENIFAGNESERRLDYIEGEYLTVATFPAFDVNSLDTVVVAKPYPTVKEDGQIEERDFYDSDSEVAERRQQTLMWQGLIG